MDFKKTIKTGGGDSCERGFYPLFEEKVGIVLLSGSEVGLESKLSRRFEVPRIRKSHFPSSIYIMYRFCD